MSVLQAGVQRQLMDGRALLLLASLFLAFDRFSVGLWADLEATFAPTGLFSDGLNWSPFTLYPAMVREIKANQSQSTVIAALPFGINPFYAFLHGLHLPAAMVCLAGFDEPPEYEYDAYGVRQYSYIGLELALLLLGLRSCLPSAIRVWLEDPTDGLAALWNSPVQLAAAASPAWEALRWLAALLNVCWVGLSLSAFHRHGAQDGALFHGRGGVRLVPAHMVALVVLSSGVLVSMLALLAPARDEGAVSGAEAEAEAEGVSSNCVAAETSLEGIPPRENSGSHGPYGPNIRSGAAPLPPYHSAHRAVLLAALPAGIACALTLAREWPVLALPRASASDNLAVAQRLQDEEARPAARGTVARRSTAGSGRAAGGGPAGGGVLRFYTEESPGFAMYIGLPLCSSHAPLWPRVPLRLADALSRRPWLRADARSAARLSASSPAALVCGPLCTVARRQCSSSASSSLPSSCCFTCVSPRRTGTPRARPIANTPLN